MMPAAAARLRPDLPAQIDPIVLRMLREVPGERYARLGRAGAGARPRRPPQRVRPGHSRQRRSTLRCARASLLSRPHAMPSSGSWCAPATGDACRARRSLVREGDVGDSLFILAEGEAKVTIQGKLLNVLRAGECFGEMAYVRGETQSPGHRTNALPTRWRPNSAAPLDAMSLRCRCNCHRALCARSRIGWRLQRALLRRGEPSRLTRRANVQGGEAPVSGSGELTWTQTHASRRRPFTLHPSPLPTFTLHASRV